MSKEKLSFEEEYENKIVELSKLLDGTTKTVVTNDRFEVLFKGEGEGVKDMRFLFHKKPELIEDNIIFKDVCGGVNAMLAILGGAKEMHCKVISNIAKELLADSEIIYSYDSTIDYVLNSDKTDICPMEKIVRENPNDLKKALELVEAFIVELKNKQAK